MAANAPLVNVPDLDLVAGGPTYRLLVLARLAKDRGPVLRRSAVVLVALTWLPLLVLSIVEGNLSGGVTVPFLRDPAPHARFLIALPLLVLAEGLIGARLVEAANRFAVHGLVPADRLRAFSDTVSKALRRRDSRAVEPVLLVAVFVFSILARLTIAAPASRWDVLVSHSGLARTAAGWWEVVVAAPVFTFLFVRWLWRLGIWYAFLKDTAGLGLRLVPTHPDRLGGLAFVPLAHNAFDLLVFAFACSAAGVFGREVLYDGVPLQALAVPAIGFLLAALLVFVAPLLVLSPPLLKARWRGFGDYGALAGGYVRDFEDKWVRGTSEEALLGSSDVQSLADIGAAWERPRQMALVPVTKASVLGVALATVLPMIPVVLTKVPAKELVKMIAKVLA